MECRAKKLAVKISSPTSVTMRLPLDPMSAPVSMSTAAASTTRPRPKRETKLPARALDHVPDRYIT